MRGLHLERLRVRAFRNLANQEVVLGPRFNVVSGDNGQGKTNLLESIYVVATSRSFRTSRMSELVAFGETGSMVSAVVSEDGLDRDQSLAFGARGRSPKVNGKRPASLAAYAVHSPVVVFHPGETALSMGASSERRRLLDRVGLYLSPCSLSAVEAYGRAMRSRQRLLESRGLSAKDADLFESLMVEHGLAVAAHRERAAIRVATVAQDTYARLGGGSASLSVEFVSGAPRDAVSFASELRSRRASDLRRRSAAIGAHRDELLLLLDGRPVRGNASQGQHRAVTLSLKAAETRVIGEARGVRPILLLDDVSSELDETRSAALFSFLREEEGQIVLSTTRPEWIPISGAASRCDFVVRRGIVDVLPSPTEVG